MDNKANTHLLAVLATLSCALVLCDCLASDRNPAINRSQPLGQRYSSYETTLAPRNSTEKPRSTRVASKTTTVKPKSSSKAVSSNRSQSRNQTMDRRSDPSTGAEVDGDTRVPFWNIAHMINSIEQVKIALDAGSNGIETDVSFNADGTPAEAYHGFPCDCGRHCHYREDFTKFVQHLAKITTPPATSRLLLVLFDLKLKDLTEVRQKQEAGRQLARIIYENLYAKYQRAARAINDSNRAERQPDVQLVQPPLRVVISINHAHDSPLVQSFIDYTRDNRLDFMRQIVGFDVGMNDDLKEISAMWDSLNGQTLNIWQGDGLTNCANIVRGVERLKEAISMRNGQSHFRKIYYWTVDVLYHIRSVLRFGIDAVLTNQPQRVLQVLEEREFKSKYRLATPYDDPFQQFWIKPSAWQMSLPSLEEARETIENIQKTSTNFVRTLPDGISAALKKVQSSISSIVR